MSDNKITIQIIGGPATGKSTLMYLIGQYLQDDDFDVQVNHGIDYIDENHFVNEINRNINDRITNIQNKNIKIELHEVHSKRKLICTCNDGFVQCPGCNGKEDKNRCAGCEGSGVRICGKCNTNNK